MIVTPDDGHTGQNIMYEILNNWKYWLNWWSIYCWNRYVICIV